MKNSSLQFTNPVLTECFFSINNKYDSKNDRREAVIEAELGIGDKDNTKRECLVMLRLNIGIDTENNNFPFIIKIAMVANFKWDKTFDDKIDNLLTINAPALLLGYMRPIVANLTNNSPFPVYNIPFMNFADKDITVNNLK